MVRRGFFFRIVMLVVIIALLTLGGYTIYQSGLGQGYALGLQAGGAERGAGVPQMPVAPFYPYGFGFVPFLWGIGLFFKIGFFLILFLLLARLFFWGFAWRRAGGPGGRHWGRHWEHHGSPPSWHGEREDQETASKGPETGQES